MKALALLLFSLQLLTAFHRTTRITGPSCRSKTIGLRLNVAAPNPPADNKNQIFDPFNAWNKISFQEIMSPPTVDLVTVLWILLTQSLILSVCVFSQISFLPSVLIPVVVWSDGPSNVFVAQTLAALLACSLLVYEWLPSQLTKDLSRNSQMYALRLLGRKTSVPVAIACSALLGVVGALCEEIIFRGILFSALLPSGVVPAVIISSLAYGAVHKPFWGASAIVETVLGVIFAVSYVASGYNFAVPFLSHFLFDSVSLLYSWHKASSVLRSKIAGTNTNLANVGGGSGVRGSGEGRDSKILAGLQMPEEYGNMNLALFELLDADGDGLLTRGELATGLALLSVQSGPYALLCKDWRQLSDEVDLDGDGKVTFEEFEIASNRALSEWLDVQ